MAETTEMCCLTFLEANWRQKCGRISSFSRLWVKDLFCASPIASAGMQKLAIFHLPWLVAASSQFLPLYIAYSLCECLCPSFPFWKATSQIKTLVQYDLFYWCIYVFIYLLTVFFFIFPWLYLSSSYWNSRTLNIFLEDMLTFHQKHSGSCKWQSNIILNYVLFLSVTNLLF